MHACTAGPCLRGRKKKTSISMEEHLYCKVQADLTRLHLTILMSIWSVVCYSIPQYCLLHPENFSPVAKIFFQIPTIHSVCHPCWYATTVTGNLQQSKLRITHNITGGASGGHGGYPSWERLAHRRGNFPVSLGSLNWYDKICDMDDSQLPQRLLVLLLGRVSSSIKIQISSENPKFFNISLVKPQTFQIL